MYIRMGAATSSNSTSSTASNTGQQAVNEEQQIAEDVLKLASQLYKQYHLYLKDANFCQTVGLAMVSKFDTFKKYQLEELNDKLNKPATLQLIPLERNDISFKLSTPYGNLPDYFGNHFMEIPETLDKNGATLRLAYVSPVIKSLGDKRVFLNKQDSNATKISGGSIELDAKIDDMKNKVTKFEKAIEAVKPPIQVNKKDFLIPQAIVVDVKQEVIPAHIPGVNKKMLDIQNKPIIVKDAPEPPQLQEAKANVDKDINTSKLKKSDLCKLISRHYVVRANLVSAIVSVFPINNINNRSFCLQRINALETGSVCVPPDFKQLQAFNDESASQKLAAYIKFFTEKQCSSVRGMKLTIDIKKSSDIKLVESFNTLISGMRKSYIDSIKELKSVLEQLLNNPDITNEDLIQLSQKTKDILDKMYDSCNNSYILGVILLLKINNTITNLPGDVITDKITQTQ